MINFIELTINTLRLALSEGFLTRLKQIEIDYCEI